MSYSTNAIVLCSLSMDNRGAWHQTSTWEIGLLLVRAINPFSAQEGNTITVNIKSQWFGVLWHLGTWVRSERTTVTGNSSWGELTIYKTNFDINEVEAFNANVEPKDDISYKVAHLWRKKMEGEIADDYDLKFASPVTDNSTSKGKEVSY